jgi:hypothetical protein
MTDEKLTCTSCKKRITNETGRVIFPCPKCGEENIVRCAQCRKLAVEFKCKKCGFIGPN